MPTLNDTDKALRKRRDTTMMTFTQKYEELTSTYQQNLSDGCTRKHALEYLLLCRQVCEALRPRFKYETADERLISNLRSRCIREAVLCDNLVAKNKEGGALERRVWQIENEVEQYLHLLEQDAHIEADQVDHKEERELARRLRDRLENRPKANVHCHTECFPSSNDWEGPTFPSDDTATSVGQAAFVSSKACIPKPRRYVVAHIDAWKRAIGSRHETSERTALEAWSWFTPWYENDDDDDDDIWENIAPDDGEEEASDAAAEQVEITTDSGYLTDDQQSGETHNDFRSARSSFGSSAVGITLSTSVAENRDAGDGIEDQLVGNILGAIEATKTPRRPLNEIRKRALDYSRGKMTRWASILYWR
ncbi:hypothetical protein JX266_013031 [Neoarthrinium moseri]|nr:hypothetical protein JX266_013031 [Neoarthrinium moseri]